jgi:hypothetical protein
MMDDVALEPCGDLMGGVERSKRACSWPAAALAIFLRAVNRSPGGLASVCRPDVGHQPATSTDIGLRSGQPPTTPCLSMHEETSNLVSSGLVGTSIFWSRSLIL